MSLIIGLISLVWASPRAFILDNGMQVVLEETTHIPQASMQLHFSFAPERYPEGLPHLVEHLLFEMEKDGLSYDAWVEKSRGSSNAKTRWSELIIETTVHKDSVQGLLEWEAHRMKGFCDSLTTKNIENQKMVIVQEMLNLEFRHLGSVPDRLRKAVFSAEPVLGAEVMGSIPDLESIQKEDLCQFASEVLIPSRARLHLVGAISADKSLDFEAIFSESKTTSLKGEVMQMSSSVDYRPEYVSTYQPTRWFLPSENDSILYVVWPAPAYGSAMEIASDFIMEQMVSVQNSVFAENFTSVSGWSENDLSCGWRVLEIETEDPEQALRVLALLLGSGELWLDAEDIQLFQIKTRSLIAKLSLKNTERARLLGECSSIEKGATCLVWEETRRRELRLEEAVAFLQADYSLDSASLLWIGAENKLEGERLP